MQFLEKKSIEYQLKDDDILYFLHIPKTAGTTFSYILDSYFDLDSICPEKLWNKLYQNNRKNLSKFRLIRGHFGYGIYRILPKRPLYLTILRDPVEQQISRFFRSKYNPPPNAKSIPSENFSDVIKRMQASEKNHNYYTRYIAIDIDVFPIIEKLDPKLLKYFRYLKLINNEKNFDEDELLKIAKKRISEFTFLGLVEKIEESLFLLYYTFGWLPISSPWKLNPAKKNLPKDSPKRPKREELEDETIQEIKNIRKKDLELYQYATQLFDNRYTEMVKDLKEKYYTQSLEKLSFKDAMYEMLKKHYEDRFNKSDVSQLTSINYDFSSKLSGTGWYWREFIPENNRVFRWTGPVTDSTIDFPLITNHDLLIQISIFKGITPEILNSFRLKVNDQFIDLKKLDEKDEQTLFEGLISKHILQNKNKFTRFSFLVNRTINPHSLNNSDNTNRELGIALDGIKITPQV